MSLLEHLESTFAIRANRNPKYSLRSFARFLEIDPTALSQILRGKRKISAAMATKVVQKIGFPAKPSSYQELTAILDPGSHPHIISLQQLEEIASWEHFAILSLLEIKGFEATTRAIAERLNISFAVANQALKRLEYSRYVQKSDNFWILLKKNLATPTDVPSAALRKLNRGYIEKSLDSLENDPIDLRDISGVTMTIDPSFLPEAKKLIQAFRRRMCVALEKQNQSEVYRLNIQLFPVTIPKKRS